MKQIIIPLVFACCVLSPSIHAQEYKNLDSLLIEYNSRVDDTVKVKLGALILQNLSYTNPEKAYTYAHEMVAISKRLNYKHGVGLGYNQLGYLFLNNDQMDSAYYYTKATHDIVIEVNNLQRILTANERFAVYYERINDFEAAKTYLQKNIDIFNNRDTITYMKQDDFRYIGSTYFMYSEIDLNQGRYNLALQNGLKALALYKKYAKDRLFEADAHIMLGRIETRLKNYEQSAVYLKQALAVYETFKDVLWQTDATRLIGENLILLQKPNEALEFLERSVVLAIDNDYPLKEAAAHNLIGEVYLKMENFPMALQSLDRSLNRYKQMQNPQEIGKTYQSLGELYTKTKKPEQALYYLQKATTISDSLESLPDAAKAYLTRSESYELLNDHKRALEDFRRYNQLNDQIFNQTKSQQIEEMRALFEIEKKEQQIVLQEQEIGLLEQQAKISNLQRILMGVSLILSLLGFYGIRQKLKRNKAEKEKVDAELAFKKKELTTHALNLARKNETLENLKNKAKKLQKTESATTGYNQLISTINFDLQDDNNWENFSNYFEQVHKNFNANIKEKYPAITPNELRLMALLKMNLSSKEIANILNISQDGVKKARYRLRKKLDITTDESLQDLVISL